MSVSNLDKLKDTEAVPKHGKPPEGLFAVTNQEELDRMREIAHTLHELAVQIYQVIVHEDIEPTSFEANVHDSQRDLNSLQAIIDNNKAE